MKAALYSDIEHTPGRQSAVNAISLISVSMNYSSASGRHTAGCTELTQIQLRDNTGFRF